jgi:hypothetical protein
LAICAFGFLILRLVSTLRKRRLAIWELMAGVAITGVIMATLSCFRFKALRYGQSLVLYPEPVWISLGLYYLLLIPMMIAIYRGSKH